MKNEATPAYETLEIGTPKDYSSDVYKVYFEVGEHKDATLKVLIKFLGEDRKKTISQLAYGYEVTLPIQCVPDVVGLLIQEGVAIYQVIRYAKTSDTWL